MTSRYPLIGEQEWALVEPGDLVLEARIDTGAETSSIHAENIQLLEKDSKRWVRFTVKAPDSDREIQLERRLHRRILVKQTGSEDYDRRYVVRMWITLGDTRTWLDVSLSDRDDFEFPLLIGRNMLMDAFAVDVSQHHTLPKPAPKPAKEKVQ
ncbi:ATP-dependent zinc protease [Congregibacter sp.]|uniref:ATP-dependent zinc protease family protein n=1 Tax=Congregibacter sp. TaxID=2744308 RepID=UPI0039E50954